MWERLERSLSARGIDPAMYVQMQGKSREELVTDMEGEAQQALRREAVLEAVADAEEIEVSDDDLLGALGPGDGEEPQKLLDNLREAGRDGLLRSEVRLRKAADVIAESAKPIPAEQAAARDKLWTPEKEQDEPEKAEAGLWTPGSD
jgi:trigger factor